MDKVQWTTFESRLSSRKQQASCEKLQQVHENLARSLDFSLLIAGTEAQLEWGLLRYMCLVFCFTE